MRFIILTGMSGAGKTLALRHFEDLGFFCVDNLPPALIAKFAELCSQSQGQVNKVAVVMDIRGGEFFSSLSEALWYLKANSYSYEILFLEAADETLIRRFKEVRRRHPLSGDGSIMEGIAVERERLAQVRKRADKIIDTTDLTPQQLKSELHAHVLGEGVQENLIIRVVSFGFKHGIPLDADLVFDVRFLPNPHYIPELKDYTGIEPMVRDYVLQWPIAEEFLRRLEHLLEFLIPLYIKEGKTHLVIAVGCTGGRHRSVVIANRLGEVLQAKHRAYMEHRDVSLGNE
ncbi:MAG: RNase adapter RapZ [Bacillota bacterium]